MKTRMQLIGISALLILFITSCNKHRIKPSGTITTATYTLGGYDKVIISDAIKAEISFTTGTEQVIVDANSNLHAYITTEVIGGSLFIGLKNNVHIRGNYTIDVHIQAQDFDHLSVSGASTCTFLDDWAATNQRIIVSGASKLSCGLLSNSMDMDISGASNIDLWGATGFVQMDVSGASRIGSFTWQCETLNADVSGASNVELSVSESLHLDLSGVSTLRYMGTGTIDHVTSTGGSSVIHL